jgi:hypothetical protein
MELVLDARQMLNPQLVMLVLIVIIKNIVIATEERRIIIVAPQLHVIHPFVLPVKVALILFANNKK